MPLWEVRQPRRIVWNLWRIVSILLDVVMVPIMWVVVLLVLRKLADFLVIAFCPPRAIDLYEALEPDQWALWGFAVVCNVCWVLYHATSPRPRVVGARSRP